ncbi:SMAD/FHA domain-containing protein [Mycena haematopus]|nr:SMAD/FHA domain-containing protein [Mycena haematopus]
MTSNGYPPQNAALHLYPLDDSFVPKRIALGGGVRVKIARPPNTKTQPGERNGYFDSRVLSRQHAEVWEEGGRIFIKDVKSSNGTFINGERLSLEGRESDPSELKSDDILEFGVDIVAEDNKTVLHRKVVARVACLFPATSKSPPLPHDQFAALSQSSATFNGILRRPIIHQGLAGLGSMGAGARAPGRGLTLDHIFSRLQAELAKSRETGRDLQVLTGALAGVEETLGGVLVGLHLW